MATVIRGSDNYHIMNYLINHGPLTNPVACSTNVGSSEKPRMISFNLRSRVVDLKRHGFDIKKRKDSGRANTVYYIPDELLEANKQRFIEAVYGTSA